MHFDSGYMESDGLPPTIPPPKWIHNVSCYNPRLVHDMNAVEDDIVSFGDVIKFFMLLLTTFLTLTFNTGFFIVLNSEYYSPWIKSQPKYLLGFLAINDLANGVLILGFGMYPAMFECWPYGQFFCQIQALIHGALTQQSALIFMILAAERYMVSVYPLIYSSACSSKVCVAAVILSWVFSVSLYSMIILPADGFHFNVNGLMICEPFYLSNNVLIVTSCLFYFPTTMALMYTYGTIFHSTKVRARYKKVVFSTFPRFAAGDAAAKQAEKRFLEEKMICDTMSKSSAAISLTFIIVVTPWSIQQVITSCTKTTPPSVVDFVVSWIAASHSFWSPFIYWLLNEKFRRATLHYYITKIRCLPLPLTWSSEAGMDTIGDVVSAGVNGGITDTNGIHEKFWGEILDRAVSNHSLQVLNERSQTPPSGNNGCLTTTFDSE
ncbi:trace amine-associated receptor 8b [Lepeophtheirus salmonis]|uniref:trace amine-associated receptor 8b n=1 Tax=Lepeophtheirus salmonis TaxID=72036 RepID=UPI001AE57F17|nr:trace amine-associated receptor 8b-like [Lepeophtheirus salmonis]